MAKDAFYFSHDYNPTGDPKVQAMIGEYGANGYGLYWRIVELMHSEESHQLPKKEYLFLAIAKQMLTNADQVLAFVEDCTNRFELFISDGDHFWSSRVLRNIDKRNNISVKRSEAGKIGANAKQTKSNARQNVAKERKVNESKVNIKPPPSLEDVLSYFKENGYDSQAAKRAFNYYTELEWKDANDKPVKSWKSKMQAVWFKPENKDKSIPEPRKMVI